MRRVLGPRFFKRSARIVARELLGKFLVRRLGKREVALMITETEAYDGPKDLACHGRFGKTRRNAVMFSSAGYFYIYFVYGMYWMLNIVVGKKGYPAAVLIRGVEGLGGPGRLTRELKITRSLNGCPAASSSGLWFENRGVRIKNSDVQRTARIGVSYAGPVWANKKYRFVAKVKAAR